MKNSREPRADCHARKLLIMAAAVHGLGPETDLTYANTTRVMRQALHWAGLLLGDIEQCFESYDQAPPVTEFYDALTSMILQSKPAEALFEGGGNWGGPGLRPAAAHFTSCRLTERGWSLGNQLLERHPRYRQDIYERRRGPTTG
jgi:hypothetical protein